jgi:hypothetical protein
MEMKIEDLVSSLIRKVIESDSENGNKIIEFLNLIKACCLLVSRKGKAQPSY